MNKYLYIIVSLLLGVYLGFAACLSYFYMFKDSGIFFKIDFFQITQMFSPFILATFIFIIVNKKVNSEAKKVDFKVKLIDFYLSSISKAYKKWQSYFKTPSSNFERDIKLELHQCSIILSSYLDLSGHGPSSFFEQDTLKKNFFTFKKLLTDTPFGQTYPIISAEKQKEAEEVYQVLFNQAVKCQANAYSV